MSKFTKQTGITGVEISSERGAILAIQCLMTRFIAKDEIPLVMNVKEWNDLNKIIDKLGIRDMNDGECFMEANKIIDVMLQRVGVRKPNVKIEE